MSVLSLFHLEIKPAVEKDFLQDFVATLAIGKKQKGLRYVQAFTPVGEQHKYLLITEWDSEAHIESWLNNSDHKKVMAKAEKYVANHSIKRYASK